MAGGKSTTFANTVLTNYIAGKSLNIALYTDATGRATAPTTEVTTVQFPGYSRQSGTFGAASNGSTSNTNAVDFVATGAMTVPVNYYAILDGTGAIQYWAPLQASRQLAVSGDKIDFAIGAIVVTEA